MRSEIRTVIILVVVAVGIATINIIFSTLETQNTILNTINEESGLKTQSIDKRGHSCNQKHYC